MTKLFARLSAAVVVLGVACSVEVDVTNKACPCGDGLVCDTQRDLCVAPQDLRVEAPPPPACVEPCPCGGDADCKDANRPRCSPAKTCVQCNQEPDTCPAGSYCNAQLQCTLGCKQESDCQISPAAPHCERTRHRCVECVSPDQCTTGGKTCSPGGTCVDTCEPPGRPCSGGQACCAGLCIDTQSDVLSCGGCGVVCSVANGTPSCNAGACGWACADGFTHCDSGNTGCETNTRSDLANCGACQSTCDDLNADGVTCTGGACAFTACKPGFADCDDDTTNGCECTCGQQKGARCCPGNVCAAGLQCNGGSGKCQ